MPHLFESATASEQQIAQQAAEWVVLLSDEAIDAAHHAQFQQWLALSPKHQAAYTRLQNLIDELGEVRTYCPDQASARRMIDQSLSMQHPMLAQLKKTMLVLGLMSASVLMMALLYAPASYWLADQHNTSQSWQKHTLSDQSQIQLAGKTAINLQFGPHLRKIELLQGNIMIDVAKDPTRPLVVETRHGVVQALGTRFIVTQDGQKTIVSMLQSKTMLWSHQQPQQKIAMIQGQRLELNAQGVLSRQPIQINAELLEQAWQQRRLMVNAAPLDEVLDYLAMFSPAKINFDRQAFAALKVTASLSLEDIDASLAQLADELDLQVVRPLPYWIQLKIKPSQDMPKTQ
jgi:transmembrane sensor